MDVSGERRLPSARDVAWNGLSDIGTITDSVPAGVTIVPAPGDGFDVTVPDGGTVWRTRATVDPGSGPAHAVIHLAAPPDSEHGVGGRAEITMAEDGVFTRLLWRITADLPDAERPRVEAAMAHFLTHLGQRAATPAPIAVEGIAGATAAIVNNRPSASAAGSPLQVIGRTLAAMPRDSTIGGAVFVLVVLFVVGIL